MTWMSDVIAGAGPGAAGAALAAAVYSASVLVERDARPEAKRDVARFLANFPDDVGFPLVARHISGMFCSVFGARQFSRTCVLRSTLATFSAALIAFSLEIVNDRGDVAALIPAVNSNLPRAYASVVLIASAVSVVPDYMALWKTRLLIRLLDRVRSAAGAFAVVAADMASSLLLMVASVLVVITAGQGGFVWHVGAGFFNSMPRVLLTGYGQALGLTQGPAYDLSVPIFFTATILTSIWTVLIFVSALVARLILQLRHPLRVLAWLYDPEQHAIRIVGLVMAAIVWIACLAISLA